MSESFFSQHEDLIFQFLQQLLELGPNSYKRPVLGIIHSLLLYVDPSKSFLYQNQQYGLIKVVTSLLDGPLWQEATRVLDVAVRSASRG
jgi:hypothetical protein